MTSLKGKTWSSPAAAGASARRSPHAAREGANIALIAKTTEPHPQLPGTIFTAAEAIEQASGSALPIVGDIRDDEQVRSAVAAVVERFWGIDVVVNNASAPNLTPSDAIDMKRYDLMQDINARGAFSPRRRAFRTFGPRRTPIS